MKALVTGLLLVALRTAHADPPPAATVTFGGAHESAQVSEVVTSTGQTRPLCSAVPCTFTIEPGRREIVFRAAGAPTATRMTFDLQPGANHLKAHVGSNTEMLAGTLLLAAGLLSVIGGAIRISDPNDVISGPAIILGVSALGVGGGLMAASVTTVDVDRLYRAESAASGAAAPLRGVRIGGRF